MEILIAILVTFWGSCGLFYTFKSRSLPFHNTGILALLDFIFSPYFIISDIIYEWNENKELRDRYK